MKKKTVQLTCYDSNREIVCDACGRLKKAGTKFVTFETSCQGEFFGLGCDEWVSREVCWDCLGECGGDMMVGYGAKAMLGHEK